MASTIETLARFMGWAIERVDTGTGMGDMVLVSPDDGGPAVTEISRGQLQTVLEDLDSGQRAELSHLIDQQFAAPSFASALYLKDKTLARLIAQVVARAERPPAW